jgi:hypothetical protein
MDQAGPCHSENSERTRTRTVGGGCRAEQCFKRCGPAHFARAAGNPLQDCGSRSSGPRNGRLARGLRQATPSMAFVGTCLRFWSLPADAPLARMPSRLFLRAPKPRRRVSLHYGRARQPQTPRFLDASAGNTAAVSRLAGRFQCTRESWIAGLPARHERGDWRYQHHEHRAGPVQERLPRLLHAFGLRRAGLDDRSHAACDAPCVPFIQLHRLEANIQPANLASIAVVRKCGFKKEGFSPKYLKIPGRWKDHERWAIVAP